MQVQSKISLKYTIQHLISKIMGASLYLQKLWCVKTSNISYRKEIQKVRKKTVLMEIKLVKKFPRN